VDQLCVWSVVPVIYSRHYKHRDIFKTGPAEKLLMGNFRYPIALFLASFVMLMIGLTLKIMHWPGGQLITGSMFMVQAISIVWIIVLILKPGKKP
jgi:hypothetical protein